MNVASWQRCMAVVGTVHNGPQYCGNRARAGTDLNGRPVCNIHRCNQLGIEWRGDRGSYPHGTGGSWRFARGEFR